ncbi:hypothetical protein VQ056_32810 [Paenibacillus sp. JTLBN-2024]
MSLVPMKGWVTLASVLLMVVVSFAGFAMRAPVSASKLHQEAAAAQVWAPSETPAEPAAGPAGEVGGDVPPVKGAPESTAAKYDGGEAGRPDQPIGGTDEPADDPAKKPAADAEAPANSGSGRQPAGKRAHPKRAHPKKVQPKRVQPMVVQLQPTNLRIPQANLAKRNLRVHRPAAKRRFLALRKAAKAFR